MKRTIYRDRLTGRFAKRSSWTRSKAKGGKRYVRQSLTVKKKPKAPPPRPPKPPEVIYEWVVTIQPSAKSERSFDVIVTASDETEAYTVARKFLARDPQGQRIVRAGGWAEAVAARGVRSNEEAGEAEYRSKSRKK